MPPEGVSPRRGRPRRLQLEQVIDAALAVGLQQLTMAAVAERLGVGKAVLYGYVGSRAELVQLAAARAVRRHRFPEDRGQPWRDWVVAHARALFEVLTKKGELLEAWLSGEQSVLVEIDAAEAWLAALTTRGFSGEEALQLRRAVSHVVIGAAAGMRHDAALRRLGRPRGQSARKAALARPEEETPLLRRFADVFAREVTEQNWEYAMFLLLEGAAARRDALALVDGDSRAMFAVPDFPTA